MTKNLNIKLIAAAFVAASAATLFSMGSANASMSAELQNCKTNSRSHTTHCCQAIVGQNLPIWMRESGRNCASSVSCVGMKGYGDSSRVAAISFGGGKKKGYCYISFYPNIYEGGKTKIELRSPRGSNFKN
jgi:hypothetical protein